MESENFSSLYPAGEEMVIPTEADLQAFTPYVNPYIASLWTGSGFGVYGDGFIQLVDPREWNPRLEKWLGRTDPTNTMLLISWGGHIFYHKDLGEHELEGQMYKVEEINWLNPNTGEVTRVATDAQQFFEEWLTHPEIRARELRQARFEYGVKEYGPLAPGEIFYEDPTHFEGGGEEVINLEKVDALEHLVFLFEDQY